MKTIKKGDKVLILTGDDVGKTGQVEKILSQNSKAVLAGLNQVKKHVKKSARYPQGGIIVKNSPIDVSNLCVICPNCGRPTRISVRIVEKSRLRICKKCRGAIDKSK